MIIKVPIEFKKQFMYKPERSVMTLAGFGVRTGQYYLRDPSLLDNWSDRENPLDEDGRIKKWFVGNKQDEYYVHIDLGLTRDRCGFAMGHSKQEKKIMDLVFALEAKQMGGEIDINEVINLIVTLKNHRRFNIRKVSFDQFQSRFVMQQLRQLGIRTEYLSVDKDTKAYDCWKEFLLRGQFDIYDVPLYRHEAKHLIRVSGNKIDHPKNGSKDVTDAVAGVCYHLAVNDRQITQLRGVVN